MANELRGLVLIGLLTVAAYLFFVPMASGWTVVECLGKFATFVGTCEALLERLVLLAGVSASAAFWAWMWYRATRRS